MLFKSIKLNSLIIPYSNKFVLHKLYSTRHEISKPIVTQSFRRTSTSYEGSSFLEGLLKEVFKFKSSNVSHWIIENKARTLCSEYLKSDKSDRQQIICTLASSYAVQHEAICNAAKKLLTTESDNERRMISYERSLKNVLTPDYQWLFVIIGRLENGVKFLVDLRTDIMELILQPKDTDKNILVQQLNITLRDLLLLWFSVGFLHLERITWQTSCDILQKISDYEAIHPIKNWLDLKQRVGPYRRCYIFTHPSMPREPLVVLHIALCDVIPDSVKGIEEAKSRILGGSRKEVTFFEENKCKITTAIFYSITSTQKGLQGIELGNYLIKEAAKKVISEFPFVNELSTLSPIPDFRSWLLEKTKQGAHNIFTNEECKSVQSVLGDDNITLGLRKLFNNSLWISNIEICEVLKEPLLRACAWYLYKEKRRNYALNSVANFHLRNGAVMWRINWLADPSPRGVANSCGLMINYRYYLDECEENSQRYIENHFIKASENIIDLAMRHEILYRSTREL